MNFGGNELMREGKVKVVLADRDRGYMNKVRAYLETKENMQVVAMTDNGEIAIQKIKETGADVLLIDMLLGEKDGIWVLETMHSLKLSVKACIVVSAINNDRVVRQVMAYGVDYYMAKPVQCDILYKRIEELLSNNGISKEYDMKVSEMGLEQETSVEELECEISNILNRMGIPASIKGYHYIRKAVMMAVEDQEVLIGITKGLYPDIAKHYKTSASKVERAIRHAIESSWKRNGQEVFKEFGGYCGQNKPTNGQFIATMSEFFRMNYKRNTRKTA